MLCICARDCVATPANSRQEVDKLNTVYIDYCYHTMWFVKRKKLKVKPNTVINTDEYMKTTSVLWGMNIMLIWIYC